MARRKKRSRSGGPLGWFRTIGMLIAAGTALFYQLYQWTALAPGDKARIFAAYADLKLKPETLRRMPASPRPPGGKPGNAPWRRIARVIDGDSIELENGEKIRLIGIDAPESSENNAMFTDLGRIGNIADKHQMVSLGREATRYARSLAEGRRCWLEYEQERVDQYGRQLAYVHMEDGTILNEEMLYRGYAKVYLSFSFKYKKRYINLQMAAMAKRNGFWAGEEEGVEAPEGRAAASNVTRTR